MFRFAAFFLAALPLAAQWAVTGANDYRVVPNVTYLTASNFEAKLDVYHRSDTATIRPVLINIHGGGWMGGDKERELFSFLPFLEMGYNVVNVEYRLGGVALAPAAVEDCLCALKWVSANAKAYGFDIGRIVTMGGSAGGHLALTTGMIPESAGLDRQCPMGRLPKVAAIVNWYGITDVNDLLEGPSRQLYAIAWLAAQTGRDEVAHRVSPLTYVREGLPPVITIHGDADRTVPYTHALRLKEALTKVKVPNQLVTVTKGVHGGFPREERIRIYTAIREFLTQNGFSIAP